MDCLTALRLGFMPNRFVLLSVLIAVSVAPPGRAEDPMATRDEAVAAIKLYCVECHGPSEPEAGVRLDTLLGDVRHEGSRWTLVLRQIKSGKMPPKDAPQPKESGKQALAGWIADQLATHAPAKPNLGNLVPHELLFGSSKAASSATRPPAARMWRMSGSRYWGWIEDTARGVPGGIVQPFSAGPERGLKDFAELARVDEPTTEILFRNALVIVEDQTSHTIVGGKVQPRHDTVREFVELMGPNDTPTREQLHKAIQKQFSLAIGRPPSPEDADQLLALYDRCAAGGDRPGAVKAMLTAVLLRSDVIFRSEFGDERGWLTPRETAAAISAALMNRRELKIEEAAARGELTSREAISQHVERILKDPKISKPRLLGFFQEYFEYGNAVEVFKDEPKELWHRPEQHVRDTDLLILHVLAQDEDVFRQLLLTPLAFANVKMATNKTTRQEEITRALVPNPHNQRGKTLPEELYGVKTWSAKQPFEQQPRTRIGILMQPSWLVAWSENFHTDIVRRGRFIRERFLGQTVPDLPIGVAAMVPNDRTKTMRERVSSVTREQKCWKCHEHMDDLGLPFEQFDHYGRLLDQDWVLDPEATKKNIDYKGKPLGDVLRGVPLHTSGAIAGTGDPKLDGPVKDAYELVARLANSDRCRQVWIRHVFRYYLGRNETLADAKTLQDADREYVNSGGSYRALLVSLLTSDSFLRRSSGANPATEPTSTTKDQP